ncbi:MAG: alpha/beta fold hydrolase [Propionicimonas sp.]|uniref:alpha/beta hydrolase n=1 Tax=Propionicimonas sp. TaxID=1955623 RepID=UPI002B20296E|nr:alpha/beta fold hydrolase [Propionicimonas sp.]MEA4943303.1 alpha/beta fold hydrolase [Propionicimonas sp.]
MQVPDYAQPFHAGDGPTAVLFCHGFTASPWTMLEWAKATAAAGHRVAVPRLPGHGTSWQGLNATDWRDWYACVEREFRALVAEADQVFIAGLSMGGALALRLAAHYRDQVAGIALVNPAVLAYPKDRMAVPLSAVIRSVKGIGSDIAKPDVDERAYDRTPVRAAASMMRMWTDVRATLDLVICPTLIFRSAVDHVVPAASTQFILNHISSEEITEQVLTRSYHVATMDYDAEQIVTGTLNFIAAHSG